MDNSIRNKRKTKVRVACAVMGAMSILVLALYGCQPAQTSGTASKSDEAATESITLTDWSPSTDCATCHSNEVSSEADTACTASKHASLSCADCHSDTEKLAKLHN